MIKSQTLPHNTPIRNIDRALQRILVEVQDGLRHGHFTFTLVCEIANQERRSLTLHAGKSYRFLIPKEDCTRSTASAEIDSRDGSDPDAT